MSFIQVYLQILMLWARSSCYGLSTVELGQHRQMWSITSRYELEPVDVVHYQQMRTCTSIGCLLPVDVVCRCALAPVYLVQYQSMWSSTSRSWLSINKFLQLNAAKNNVLQLLKILSFPFISKMLSSSVWPYFKLYLNPAPLCVIGQMLLLVSSLRAGLLQCTIQGINLKVRAVVSGSWRD